MERNEKFRPFLRVLDKESKEKNSCRGRGEEKGERRTQGKENKTKNESFETETQVE